MINMADQTGFEALSLSFLEDLHGQAQLSGLRNQEVSFLGVKLQGKAETKVREGSPRRPDQEQRRVYLTDEGHQQGRVSGCSGFSWNTTRRFETHLTGFSSVRSAGLTWTSCAAVGGGGAWILA